MPSRREVPLRREDAVETTDLTLGDTKTGYKENLGGYQMQDASTMTCLVTFKMFTIIP